MKKFFYTFGQSHKNLSGHPMKGYYVQVNAVNGATARKIFCRDFAAPEMGDPMKWAFEYKEKDFRPQFCPNGKYRELTQRKRAIVEESTTKGEQ